jgi:hypothetical protein
MPERQPKTQPTVIKLIKVRVQAREPPLRKPPDGRWVVKKLSRDDLTVIWKNILPAEEKRILAGFMKTGDWSPAYFHSDYLLGPLGGHMNISGRTGVAAKTSYALFQVYSMLSWAENVGERIAAVLFNVKRFDFLGLHHFPKSREELEEWISAWVAMHGLSKVAEDRAKSLWDAAEKCGLKLYADEHGNPPFKIKYFTYPDDPYSLQEKYMLNPIKFKYGLRDLTVGEVKAGIFEEEEEPRLPQINLIERLMETINDLNLPVSFRDLLSVIDYQAIQVTSMKERYRLKMSSEAIGLIPVVEGFYPSTAQALTTRVRGFLARTKRVIDATQPCANPIKFEAIEPGINVIQLHGLGDAEKRVVVNAVLREIFTGLEAERRVEGERRIDRVVVVVDELNKYAPVTKSPIKDQIVEIVARGRDMQLILIGAEQFASSVDHQVRDNADVKVVGRSESGELEKGIYTYLGGLKDKVPLLEQGEMVVSHHVYPSPLLLHFPPPLHDLWRAYEESMSRG